MISQATLKHNLNITTAALNRCIGAARFIAQTADADNGNYNVYDLINDLNAVAHAMAILCGEFDALNTQPEYTAQQSAFTHSNGRLNYAEK